MLTTVVNIIAVMIHETFFTIIKVTKKNVMPRKVFLYELKKEPILLVFKIDKLMHKK